MGVRSLVDEVGCLLPTGVQLIQVLWSLGSHSVGEPVVLDDHVSQVLGLKVDSLNSESELVVIRLRLRESSSLVLA